MYSKIKEKISTLAKGDQTKKEVLSKFADKVKFCLKNHEITFTDFLDPEVIQDAYNLFWAQSEGLQLKSFGGYEGAEYAQIAIFYDYNLEEDIVFPMKVLSAKITAKDGEVSHRDVLGSLMGLGISRNKLGDIIVNGLEIQIIAEDTIADYLLYNLEKVSRYKVSCSLKDVSELVIPEKEYIKKNGSVSSLRLDGVISEIYNISRSDSQKFIKSGKVKLNHIPTERTSVEVGEGDLISVRTKGRAKLLSIDGKSKKDKFKITTLIYK